MAMRYYGALIGAMIVFAHGLAAAAQTVDRELSPYAVHIDRTPQQSWPGFGIYLGDGYVLTASHVVGSALVTKPQVEYRGERWPAPAVKEGTFETNDLTLLRVDPARLPGVLQLRRMDVCKAPPMAGQPVAVVTPEGVTYSHVLPTVLLPADMRARFPTAIADVYTTGNSGSGVFDLTRDCLMGIISRKIERITNSRKSPNAKTTVGIGKYFVAAPEIRAFLPREAQF